MDWALGKMSSLTEWSGTGTGCPEGWGGYGKSAEKEIEPGVSNLGLEQAAQRGRGVIVPGGVQKRCRHGTSGHGLGDMVVLN